MQISKFRSFGCFLDEKSEIRILSVHPLFSLLTIILLTSIFILFLSCIFLIKEFALSKKNQFLLSEYEKAEVQSQELVNRSLSIQQQIREAVEKTKNVQIPSSQILKVVGENIPPNAVINKLSYVFDIVNRNVLMIVNLKKIGEDFNIKTLESNLLKSFENQGYLASFSFPQSFEDDNIDFEIRLKIK